MNNLNNNPLAVIVINGALCDLVGAQLSSNIIDRKGIGLIVDYVESDFKMNADFVYSFVGKTIYDLAEKIVEKAQVSTT